MTIPAATPTLVARPLTVEVRSFAAPHQVDGGGVYQVQMPHCTCPDFFHRSHAGDGYRCKHLRAAVEQVGAWRTVHGQEEDLAVRVLIAEVRSLTNLNVGYTVRLPHCTCPDQYFRDYPGAEHQCKHLTGALEGTGSWRTHRKTAP